MYSISMYHVLIVSYLQIRPLLPPWMAHSSCVCKEIGKRKSMEQVDIHYRWNIHSLIYPERSTSIIYPFFSRLTMRSNEWREMKLSKHFSCTKYINNIVNHQFLRKVDRYRSRIAGKSIPMEKFCSKRASRGLRIGSLPFANFVFEFEEWFLSQSC